MFATEIHKRRVAHMGGYPQWRGHLDEVFVKVNGKLHYLSPRRCQSNGGSSMCSATAISRATIYAARARHSAKAAERLCL